MANDEMRRYWRSIDEREPDAEFLDRIRDEFPEPAVSIESRVGRRGFLKAAGFGVAGSLAAGCQRGPVHEAIPFLDKPEAVTPGRALWYASTCGACAAGCGVLVKVRDGRPIKLEGNPDHPLSRGGLCAAGQAAVLGLYDSRRHVAPLRKGQATTWAEVDREIGARLGRIRDAGRGVRLLTGTITSPTLQAGIDRFLAGFANARHVVYDALSSSSILDAHERTHGRRVLPHYRFDRAAVIVGVDADFLGTWISPVEFTRGWRDGRSLEGDPPRCSYHAQFEGRLSITGSKADLRVLVAPDEDAAVVAGLAAAIAHRAGVEAPGGPGAAAAASMHAAAIDAVAARLWDARGASLVVSGVQDVGTQVLVNHINHLLGNYGATVDLDRHSRQRQGDDRAVAQLAEDLRAGGVAALLVAHANPMYDLPLAADLQGLVDRLDLFVSFAGAPDETSARAEFVCPDHHPLESWGDAEAVAGQWSLVQPAVNPLGATRAMVESLAAWTGEPRSAYDLVREHWARTVWPAAVSPAEVRGFWDRSLHDGVAAVSAPAAPPAPAMFQETALASLAEATAAVGAASDGALALVLHPTVGLLDGRHAHNPWLQELPDPVSKVTWDNVASLSPATAGRLGLQGGDLVRVSVQDGAPGSATLTLPVYVQPGQHDRVVAVALGYGRAGTDRFAGVGPRWIDAQPGVGANGLVGTNAAPLVELRAGTLRYSGRRAAVTPAGGRQDLAITQTHHSIIEPRNVSAAGARPIVRETTVAGLAALPPREPVERDDLWPDDHPMTGHKWGMVVDLHACTGCSACVVSCQAENNIPVVGRDEVRRQREMHWLRIDRYFTDAAEQVDVVYQPMMCQHCANASCESVCPVLATVHSDEGLNEQVYNRCVGTRYCANNCAYKVRRFNWFTYARPDDRENLVLNPDVSVRTRGVMEKCSFCVQRIQEAKIDARRRGAVVADGDVRTACEQSCPAGAIVFGDLNDPTSRVAALARAGRSFRVLEELNGRPHVGYLAVVRNRAAAQDETHHD